MIRLFLYTFCVLNFALSQDVTFEASVNKNRLAMGEQLEVTFTLQGATGGKNFRPPAFNDFLVLSGPNQATSMQFINGAMSASISYSYIVQPRSEGKLTIESATIEYGGKQLKTQPITIEVSKATAQPKQRPEKQDDSDIAKQIGDNLFMKVSVDKSRVYQGEQITAIYKIYTRVSITNYSITKVPSLSGFWSEDLDIPQQVQQTTEVIDGKQYRVGILKKVALFPQRSGTLTIDPMEVECMVQVQTRKRSRDFFDDFFSDPFFGTVKNVPYKVQNNPVRITVQPLPADNVPTGFSGTVGKFTMEAWLDKQQTKTNDAVTLKVKISGKGNLKLIEAPSVIIPPDIESYDPKISDNITKQGGIISGSRTFEYLLIPRHPGQHRIAPVIFSFFDLEKKNYSTLRSSEFILNVEKGSDISSIPTAGLSKEDIKLLGEDIRFIKSGKVSFHRQGKVFFGSFLFYILTFSPMILFVGLFVYIKHREKLHGNVRLMRSRKAEKIARRRLALAKKFLQEKKNEEFYTEISRALWGYVSDKLGIPVAELSIDFVNSSLSASGVNSDLIDKLRSTIEMCEFARFAPSADSFQMEQIYERSVELISSIEDHLP